MRLGYMTRGKAGVISGEPVKGVEEPQITQWKRANSIWLPSQVENMTQLHSRFILLEFQLPPELAHISFRITNTHLMKIS